MDKANAIADCLENQFTPYKLFDENHEQRMEARVRTLQTTTHPPTPHLNEAI
jgi:hypothetical protein